MSRNSSSNYNDRDRDEVGETRHHGKWTASSESRDLNVGGYDNTLRSGSSSSAMNNIRNRGDAEFDRLDSQRDNREYEREQELRQSFDNRRNRGSSGYGDNFSSGGLGGFGSSGFGSQQGFGAHPAYSSGFGSQQGFGVHPAYSSGFGSGFDSYGSGVGYHGYHDAGLTGAAHHPFNWGGYGSDFGSSYGTSAYHPSLFGQSQPAYGSSGFGSSGFGSSGYGSSGLGSSGFGSSGFGGQGYSGSQGFGSSGQGYSGSSSRGFGGSSRRSLGGQQGYSQQQGYGQQQLGQQQGFGQQGFGNQEPQVDIYENGNEYVVEMDLPGYAREHVETKLFGQELVIKVKAHTQQHKFLVNERQRVEMSRKLHLPPDANASAINASLTNGILRVTIPRNANAAATGLTQPNTTGLTQPNTSGLTGSSHTPSTTTVVTDTTTTTEKVRA